MQVCGEEGQVEVILCNPLSVPVKVESVSLHARYQPSLPLATLPAPSLSGSTVRQSDASSAQTAAHSSKTSLPDPSHASPSTLQHHHQHHPSGAAFWRPNHVGPLVLPPSGKPLRMVSELKLLELQLYDIT